VGWHDQKEEEEVEFRKKNENIRFFFQNKIETELFEIDV